MSNLSKEPSFNENDFTKISYAFELLSCSNKYNISANIKVHISISTFWFSYIFKSWEMISYIRYFSWGIFLFNI